MAIYVSNPDFGIKKDGLPCKEHSLIGKIIESNQLLQNLREIMVSFKSLLKSEIPKLLDEWMESALLYKISNINSFVKGLKSDIDAVRNAIAHPWSNGFVEGNVNRLKTKRGRCTEEPDFSYFGARWCFQKRDNASPNLTKNRNAPDYLLNFCFKDKNKQDI